MSNELRTPLSAITGHGEMMGEEIANGWEAADLVGDTLSVSQAARDLHVSRQTLHRFLAGTAALVLDMVALLGRLFGLPARDWLAVQQADDRRAELALGPKLGRIPAHAAPPALANVLARHVRPA